jgi:hypothetical protein
MAVSKSIEVVPGDAVLTSRKPEGVQVSLLNPAENGNLAYATVPRDGAGGEIFRIRYFSACTHLSSMKFYSIYSDDI